MRILYRPLFNKQHNILPSTFDSKKKELLFYKTYSDLFPTQLKPYHINSLEQIGLSNPFHAESYLSAPSDVMLPVYSESRYQYSPKTVFIPNSKVLFTLMLSCIGKKDAGELCFNQDLDQIKWKNISIQKLCQIQFKYCKFLFVWIIWIIIQYLYINFYKKIS